MLLTKARNGMQIDIYIEQCKQGRFTGGEDQQGRSTRRGTGHWPRKSAHF